MKYIQNCRGNAAAEFLIVAAVMVPALLIIPSLGKISDANQATLEASRYAVWERTVSDASQKSDTQLEIEVRNRFFTEEETLIRSDHGGVLESETYGNQFWRTVHATGQEEFIIDNEASSVSVVTRNEAIPGGTGADILSEGIATIGDAMGSMISDAEWDLEPRGFYVAEISTELRSTRLYENETGCSGSAEDSACITQRYAMLVDAWNSGSPDQTRSRVRSLVPAGALEPIGNAISVFGNLPLFEELENLDGAFGQVREDVLPLDRFGEE